jgi:hypothetical protein
MTDVVLARKLAEAMRLAIAIRDHEARQHDPVLLVQALNECFEHIAPGAGFGQRYYRDVLAEIEAEAEGS